MNLKAFHSKKSIQLSYFQRHNHEIVKFSGVRVAPDGSVIVAGSVTIRDLNRQFDWNLSDEEAATIAGLVLHETRQIPEIGQVFKIQNFKVEVMRRHRNQLTLLRIVKVEKKAEGS